MDTPGGFMDLKFIEEMLDLKAKVKYSYARECDPAMLRPGGFSMNIR